MKFQTWWYKILKEIIVFCELKYHEALKIFKIWPFKAELLQKTELNFLPREFLLVKKLEIEKTKNTFVILDLKSCIIGGVSFPAFLLIKIPRDGNRAKKKLLAVIQLYCYIY